MKTCRLCLVILTLLALMGCSGSIRIRAEAGSTVNITDSANKTVTITTDATIPPTAMGL